MSYRHSLGKAREFSENGIYKIKKSIYFERN